MVKPDLTVTNKNNKKGKYNKKNNVYSQGYFYKNRDGNTHFSNPYIYNSFKSSYNPNYVKPKHFHKNKYNTYKLDRRREQIYVKKLDKEKSPPLKGSEEYTLEKIKETSKLIMQAILNPQDSNITQPTSSQSNPDTEATSNHSETEISSSDALSNSKTKKNAAKTKKKISPVELKALQDKIMNHITNLNDTRKKNLINSRSSEYDAVIQQIQKQKRLEISRALRDMVGPDESGDSGFFNSIIPDIGVKLTDLPKELMEQLQINLEIDLDNNDVEFNFDWPTEVEDFTADPDIKFEPPSTECVIKEEIVNTELSDGQFQENIKTSDFKDVDIKIEDIQKIEPLEPMEQVEEKKEFEMPSVVTSNPNFALETTLTPKNDKCTISTSSKFFNPNFRRKYKQTAGSRYYLPQESIDKLTDNLLLGQKRVPTPNDFDKDMDVANREFVIFEEDSVQSVSTSSRSATSKQYTFPTVSEQVVYYNVSHQTGTNNSEFDTSQCLQVTFADDSLSQSRNEKFQADSKEPSPSPSVVSLYPNDESRDKTMESTSTLIQTKTSSTQTIINSNLTFTTLLDNFIKNKTYPNSLSKAIEVVSDIDEAINLLGKYRKEMLLKLSVTDENRRLKKRIQRKKQRNAKNSKKNTSVSVQEIIARSDDTFELKTDSTSILLADQTLNNGQSSFSFNDVHQLNNQKILQFKDVSEKMLVIQCIKDQIVAASESGKILCFSCDSGDLEHQVQVANNPITSICACSILLNPKIYLYVSSIDSIIRVFDFESMHFTKDVDVSDGMRIQCMEYSWGFIFIGSATGMLKRYNIAHGRVEFSDQLEAHPIFAIKATKEGARRVLLVGSRNDEVAVRDACSGLLLRRLGGLESTVYSIVIHKSLVYCGTTNKNILIYSFHEGSLLKDYDAPNCKGISSMKVEKNLLFASSFNGIIYIYNLNNDKLVGSVDGPGGVILCMEVYKNQIIIGTMKFQFVSIPIPLNILNEFFI